MDPRTAVPVHRAAAILAGALLSALSFGLAETTLFTLAPERSEARFYVDEVLLGREKTVVGTTSQLSGEIRLDLSAAGTAEVGPVVVDARDLTTDDNRRDRQIRTRILGSADDAFRDIVFVPSRVDGLPETLAVGDTVAAAIAGDLTIRGVTREVVFDLELTVVSPEELAGLASTTVLYRDFELSIPSVPIVTGVADEVRLELAFVATTP